MQGDNSRARANLRHVMGVGWQPTAVNGNNAGSQQQGQGQLEACYGCRLATYSSERQQCRVTTAGPGPTWGMLWVQVGNLQQWTATMQGHNSRARANLRHVMGVGWQPTAVNGNNAGSQQQGQGQFEACYGCRLATYSSERQQCRVTTAGPGPTWGMLWV